LSDLGPRRVAGLLRRADVVTGANAKAQLQTLLTQWANQDDNTMLKKAAVVRHILASHTDAVDGRPRGGDRRRADA